jgi:hypothetical protein
VQKPRIIHQKDNILLEYILRERLSHSIPLIQNGVQLRNGCIGSRIVTRRIGQDIATEAQKISSRIWFDGQQLVSCCCGPLVKLWWNLELKFVVEEGLDRGRGQQIDEIIYGEYTEDTSAQLIWMEDV